MKPEELNISGETFRELREQMNRAMNNGIRGMREKGVDECTVTAKIRIEILDDEPVMKGDMSTVRMDTLKIDGKVTLTLPVKGEVKLPTKLGLKCIGNGGGFMVMDDQISIDEILQEDDDDEI
ncbi:MAG: hypothetical protein IKD50_01705 [Clostridia bacterium]|nr:hypothetical protein [Clostridia bacterium]